MPTLTLVGSTRDGTCHACQQPIRSGQLVSFEQKPAQQGDTRPRYWVRCERCTHANRPIAPMPPPQGQQGTPNPSHPYAPTPDPRAAQHAGQTYQGTYPSAPTPDPRAAQHAGQTYQGTYPSACPHCGAMISLVRA